MFGVRTGLLRLKIYRNSAGKKFYSRKKFGKYFDECERTVYPENEARIFNTWTMSWKGRGLEKASMSYQQYRRKVFVEENHRDSGVIYKPTLGLEAPLTSIKKALDVDRLKAIVEHLRVRKFETDDLTMLCQIITLCVRDFESMHTFCNECALNWFHSVEPLLEEKRESGYFLANAMVNMGRIDKSTDGGLIRALGWPRIERLVGYLLDDTRTVNAMNYCQLTMALVRMYQPYRNLNNGLPDTVLSATFRLRLRDSLPHFFDLFEKHYSFTESAKFEMAQHFFRLWYLGVPPPDVGAADRLIRFLVNDMRTFDYNDPNFIVKLLFNYLQKIDHVLQRYIKEKTETVPLDFWSNWCRSLMIVYDRDGDGNLTEGTRFSTVLLKRYLLNVYQFGLDDRLSGGADGTAARWIGLMERDVKRLEPEDLEEMLACVRQAEPGRLTETPRMLDALNRLKITLFK